MQFCAHYVQTPIELTPKFGIQVSAVLKSGLRQVIAFESVSVHNLLQDKPLYHIK